MTPGKKSQLTLLVIKPESFFRGIVGKIIDRSLRKGLRLRGIQKLQFDELLVEKQYEQYMGKNIGIDNNITFALIKGFSYAFIFQGVDATVALRNNIGF